MNDHVKIRKLTADDAIHGLRLSTQAGWNQTIIEWQLILNDPDSICLAAEIKDQVVATAAAINYSSHFTWLAMVLTDINYRKQGLSTTVLNTLLDCPGNDRLIKLDATPAGQNLYSQFGFIAEYKIFRYVHSSFYSTLHKNEDISLASIQDYQSIIQLDSSSFGADRSLLFNWMQTNFSEYTFLIANEKIDGFISGRIGRSNIHIGPLNSTNVSHAIHLLEHSLSKIKNMPVMVDVPEPNGELVNWLESKGFTRQREFVRMYKNKNVIPVSIQNQYLIAGPEFG